MDAEEPKGLIARIVATFLEGPLSVLLAIAAAATGLAAVFLTPREEEPQIVVPLADVYVHVPGASAGEVEELVATPLERHLWQTDGVEHVYSVSRRDMAVVTVRFFVGEDREESLVKLQTRVLSHIDEAPAIVAGWVIKPVEIDDVPIVTLTLSSERYGSFELRRIGEEVLARLAKCENVSRTRIVGGCRLALRVEPDPERLAAHGLSPLELERALAAADVSLTAGSFARADREWTIDTAALLADVDDIADLVVGASGGRPVHLRDVARVFEGPEEPASYTRIGLPATDERPAVRRESVTLAVAKKRGTNAVTVAERVLATMAELERTVLPDGVEVTVTRNQGLTADRKVDELLSSLAFAMLSVIGLLMLTLGWREGLIVALAVPISFALALFVNLLFGFTINRVTLFALILTLGLVVDDPITNVDNIQRHIRMGRREPRAATLFAVQEVLPPVIMSTLTVIASFVPLFFITGMMGPYMGPMAITVPLTVSFSTLAALSLVPWVSYHLLKRRAGQGGGEELVSPRLRRAYAALLSPFLGGRAMRWGLLGLVLLLLAGCGLLVVTGRVPMKMLPFDDKDELLLVIDMPEGTTLERTDAVVRDFEELLFTIPELTDFESYVGTHGPIDFNGLVRHYYFREAPNLADIRVNLIGKDRRAAQSHELALRIRPAVEALAREHGAALKIVESPPGPPVIATLVGELHGPPEGTYEELLETAELLLARMAEVRGVVDLDSTAETPRTRLRYALDEEKAALHGVDAGAAAATLRLALGGVEPATVHREGERQPLPVELRLGRAARSGAEELGRLRVKSAGGALVPLAELGRFAEVPEEQPIFHKDLERVVYVQAEMAGRAPAEAVLALSADLAEDPLPHDVRVDWAGEGEWDITLTVFRDLGIAFGAALIAIYALLIVQTGSFVMPLLVMTAIPLTAIGILPGFWLLNLVVDRPVGGFPTPVFFTATAMIGMIALGGIVVRNSIVLIEFVQGAVREGLPLRQALLESGAVRMRPILLTAATTALGAWPITLDPIFSGLAWALIFGLVASTAFTLVVVPATYYAFERKKHPTAGA